MTESTTSQTARPGVANRADMRANPPVEIDGLFYRFAHPAGMGNRDARRARPARHTRQAMPGAKGVLDVILGEHGQPVFLTRRGYDIRHFTKTPPWIAKAAARGKAARNLRRSDRRAATR